MQKAKEVTIYDIAKKLNLSPATVSRGLQDQNNNPVPPVNVGFFNNQMTFASAIGGSIDLNRSPRLVFRISPDATLTDFGGAGIHEQFTISVGLLYRFGEHPEMLRK